MSTQTLMIQGDGRTRCDRILLESLRHHEGGPFSRNQIKDLFQSKQILLKGNPLSASSVLPPGDYEVQILGLEAAIQYATPSQSSLLLPRLYEDERLLILHKPAGMPSLPHRSLETETAVGHALRHFPALRTIGSRPLEPGLLHRLDTGTSGILVFGKTQEEYLRLKTLWKAQKVRKIYRAIATGSLEEHPLPALPFWIRSPLVRDPKSSKRMIALKDTASRLRSLAQAKPLDAATQILAVRKISAVKADFEIEIKTGVMHQIRCHLASLGWPLLGDPLYRGSPSERLWLHAWKVTLPLENHSLLHLEATLPHHWGSPLSE